jgi:integrase
MIISVNEYKPSRRDAKVAKLVAKGMEQKQAEKKVAKRYECIIRMTMPGGKAIIERKLTPARTPSGAREWAEAHGRALLAEAINPTPVVVTKARVPTLAEYWPEYMNSCLSSGGPKGEGLSVKTIALKQSAFDAHLSKHLGNVPLDQIDNKKRSALQLALKLLGIGQTNILQALSRCLHKAIEDDVIAVMPCKFGETAKLKNTTAQIDAPFYLQHQYEALLAAAPDLETEVAILLGGDAGLRAGEILGVERSAISFDRMEITVCKSIVYIMPAAEFLAWIAAGRPEDARPPCEYIEKLPKHDKIRRVPMSRRLASALRKLLIRTRGERVFTQPDGQWLNYNMLSDMLAVAEQRAQLGRESEGCVHVLRHTFCSHLALAGTPARVIMELAGHHSLLVTQRYMHLAPNSAANAIANLETARDAETRPATKRDEVVTG